MTTRQATCSCGKLRLIAQGEPLRVSVCHCTACQRRTGSVFGMQARFSSDNVNIDGPSKKYVRTADSGNRITFHFCPDCGSTMYYQLGDALDMIAIPVGAFADPGFPPPQFSVYETRQHTWVVLPDNMEHFD
ncbi:MAG: GFA family protein [Proteobacteria bacterium]|nr:GFA family protein [Pseudomonadota bacterium]